MINPICLEGKRILITGASSGIGRACAVMASQLGASIILTGRRADVLNQTLSQMDKFGKHIVVSGDITSADFIPVLFEKVGKLDGFVHSAGIGPMCPLSLISPEHIEQVMQVNYYSFLKLMSCFARRKYRNERFSAVAISSVSAYSGWGGGCVYCGSKGALSSAVRAMAMELAEKGVRVNAVCPSNIKTPLYDSGAVVINDEDGLQELLKKQPLGLGYPEQVAAPVCFLLSDAASFITGVNLPVDGGYLAQ